MKVYAYGEDALTLWALQNRLPQILAQLDDSSTPSECEIFFRPSFGRRGGPNRSEFGEFDFIILARESLYLGESKWDKSPELTDLGYFQLRKEQRLRHRLFSFYVCEWGYGQYKNWGEFVEKGELLLEKEGIVKRLAPNGSLLAENLRAAIRIIRHHFTQMPQIQNVLLYLYGHLGKQINRANDFKIVSIEYPAGNFIEL